MEDTNAPVVVTSSALPSYHAEEATTATRLPARILDTDRSVQVVTPQVIEDRAVFDPQEAVQNVSGVVRAGSYLGLGENFLIRGFQQNDLIKDGFRDGTVSNLALTATGPTDIANIDRIEVLKGPSAILYGRGEPGGVVNYVTRLPAWDNSFSLEQSVGSYDFYRSVLHANWNAVPDRLALRVDAAYDRGDSFIDFVEGERFFAAPALLWQIDRDTTLRFRGEYTHEHRSTNPGVPYINGQVLPGIPYGRYFGEPGFTEFTNETYRGLVELEHRWADWARTTLSLHGRTATEKGNYFILYNFAGPLQDPVTGDISRGVSINDHEDDNLAARLDQLLEWTIYDGGNAAAAGKDDKSDPGRPTGGFPTVKNQLLLSAEYERQTADHSRILGGEQPLNPYDPHYVGYAPIPLVPFPGFPLNFAELTNTEADAYSLLAMDRISFGDTVYLSLGGRFESFFSHSTLFYPNPNIPFTSSETRQPANEFNPSAGLVVKPARNVSLYGSYAESTNTFLNAFASPTATGDALDPERSRAYEIGVKAEFFEGRLLTTAALFQIDKMDVVGPDPGNPLFSANAGDERSRGFEFDLSGEILPGWRVIANYAYIDARITSDPTGATTGHRRYGVPENSGGVFSTYEFQDGPLKGLGLGGGVYLADRAEFDNANTGTLSGYAQTDLVAYYQRHRWRAQINVKNLFDNEFYYSQNQLTTVQPAAPRTIIGSLRYEF